MSKLYIEQPIDIEITCTVSVGSMETATTASIAYLKPNGDRGLLPGALSTAGVVSYSALPSEIDNAGTWRLQPIVTFASGKILPGETVEMPILERFR